MSNVRHGNIHEPLKKLKLRGFSHDWILKCLNSQVPQFQKNRLPEHIKSSFNSRLLHESYSLEIGNPISLKFERHQTETRISGIANVEASKNQENWSPIIDIKVPNLININLKMSILWTCSASRTFGLSRCHEAQGVSIFDIASNSMFRYQIE